MNIRRFISVIVIATMLLLLLLSPMISAGGDRHLFDLMASQSVLDGIMASHETAALTANIFYNGVMLFCDKTAGRYYYSLTKDDYNPEIKLDAIDGINIIFLQSSVTAQSIRNGDTLPFLLYDKNSYCQCELAVTTLPLMSIRTKAKIGQTAIPALMQLYDNSSLELFQSQATIRTRGDSSLWFPKKSYKLTLKTSAASSRHLPLLGLRNDDDWILYAAYDEPEKLRSVLAHSLWNDIGADNNSFGVSLGAQCGFVELFIDDTYMGLYALITPVDAKQINLRKNADPTQSEYLYRSVSYEPTNSEDFHAASNSTIAGRFELHEPDNTGDTYLKWQPLDSLFTLIEHGSDEEFASKLFTMTEEENITDYWIFINTVYGDDNVEKNVNLAAKYRNGHYVTLLGAWDLDLTFGNIYAEDKTFFCQVDPRLSQADLWNSTLMQRALDLDAGSIREHIAARWNALRNSVLSDDAVLGYLSQLENAVYGSGAILRDHERWPDAAFAADTTALTLFIRQRLDYMDHYILQITDKAAP